MEFWNNYYGMYYIVMSQIKNGSNPATSDKNLKQSNGG